jgi:guanyl-specific ribonuclease Sa
LKARNAQIELVGLVAVIIRGSHDENISEAAVAANLQIRSKSEEKEKQKKGKKKSLTASDLPSEGLALVLLISTASKFPVHA